MTGARYANACPTDVPAPMSKRSAGRLAVTASAKRAARSGPRSTCVMLREF
jgi:hypothetical protein